MKNKDKNLIVFCYALTLFACAERVEQQENNQAKAENSRQQENHQNQQESLQLSSQDNVDQNQDEKPNEPENRRKGQEDQQKDISNNKDEKKPLLQTLSPNSNSDPDRKVHPAFGKYTGSEAEVLAKYSAMRLANPDWADSVEFNGDTIDIESRSNEQVFYYLLRNHGQMKKLLPKIQESAKNLHISLNQDKGEFTLTLDDLKKLPEELQEEMIMITDGSLDRSVHGTINPEFHLRTFDTESQTYIDSLRNKIDHRIEELNHLHGGYYMNPEHGSRRKIINVFDNGHDQKIMFAILEAIKSNDETAFVENMVNLATSFPESSIEAKRGFIDAFITLFVTKQFPSEGIRQNYFHFILRCGGMY